MNPSQPSVTALLSAFSRAYHSKYGTPKIFDDFLAEKLFAVEELAMFERNMAEALSFFDPEAASLRPDPKTALAWVMRAQSTPITVTRARYTEDLLEKAFHEGVRQYVILGAGMDTFAFRQPELLQSLHVYELDHPATQADKQRRISRAGWPRLERLHFVPVDFARESLQAALRSSTFDPQAPAFFSWLGVSYYLPRETVLGTLRSLASLACPGSIVVFDYLDTDAFDPRRAAVRAQRMLAAVQRAGEPMQAGLAPGTLTSALSEVGLSLLEQMAPEQLQARYFEGRADGYRAFEHLHLAAAAVQPR
jgi:methyltransferase (TIGR00027 family)